MLGSNRYRVIDLGRGKTPFRDVQATPWGWAFLQPPHVNALNQANENGRTDEVRASVGNEGQRQTTHRHHAKGHTDVLEHLPHHHGEGATCQKETEPIASHLCRSPNAPQNDTE